MLSTKAKIRIARALNAAIGGARSLVGLSSIVEVRRFGVNWRLDINEGVDLALYLRNYQNLSSRTAGFLKSGSLAIDIGANIGAHCFRIARALGPNGRVVAIEPTDYAFAKLRANANLNPDLMSRLVLVQAALTRGTNAGAETEFFSRWPLRGGAADRHDQHWGRLESAREARRLSLDALLGELRDADRIRGRVAFVKLDVDGGEREVLLGARETFTKDKPVLLIEIAPDVQDEIPGRFDDLLQTLKAYGYGLEDCASGRELPMSVGGLRKVIAKGASIDVIARPAGGAIEQA